MNYFPEKPWNTGDTFVNDTTNVTYKYDGVKWVPVSNDADLGDYLPLTGGTITGPLSVNSLLEVGGDKVEYIKNAADITQLSSSEVINAGILSNLMYNPNSGFLAEYATKQYVDDAVADIDLDNLNYLPITGGKLTGDLDVTGFKIKTLDVDSGQNSTLHLKHHGATKVYVGSDVTTFQEKVKLNKEGTEDFHAVTKAYVDNAVGNIDLGNLNYLPITGGELTGALTIRKNTQVALDIIGDSNQSQIKFWSSGAIAIQNYTGFKDNELVTKKYVDDKVAAGGSGFTPGDKVAAGGSASAVQGGFYIQNGNLYCKIT